MQHNQLQRLAVGKPVREGDLVRVWDGRRWQDGRVRKVGQALTPGLGAGGREVEIRFQGCGCPPTVQRGQCKHRFLESDCGRLWVRDCPQLRQLRRRAEAKSSCAAQDHRSQQPAGSPCPSASESQKQEWPTARYHRLLPQKSKKEREEKKAMKKATTERMKELPQIRKEEKSDGLEKVRKVRVGGRLPGWRLRGERVSSRTDTNEEVLPWHEEQRSPNSLHSSPLDIVRQPQPTLGSEGDEQLDCWPTASHSELESDGDQVAILPGRAEKEAAAYRQGKEDVRPCPTQQQQKQQRGREDAVPEERRNKTDNKPERGSAPSTLRLEFGEFVRLESRGVVWVEEGPADITLQPGEAVASGPHRRLDLPAASAVYYVSIPV